MKLESKNLAIKLRLEGKPYSEILKQVKVSKSSLTLWFRNIKLSTDQKNKILIGLEKSRRASGTAKKEKRIATTSQIIADAKQEFFTLAKNPLFLVGLSLYWAEGDKHQGERVKFTNSDPKMVAVMMRWFREICEVKEEKLRISLHIHDLLINREAQKFWHKLTEVPLKQFQKTFIKQTSLHQRRNVLYNGTCGVSVHDKALFRRIVGWKLALIDRFLSS